MVRDQQVQAPKVAVERLAREVDRFVPLVERVVSQTPRGVLDGEMVPACEELVSVFGPHMAIIRQVRPTERWSLEVRFRSMRRTGISSATIAFSHAVPGMAPRLSLPWSITANLSTISNVAANR